MKQGVHARRSAFTPTSEEAKVSRATPAMRPVTRSVAKAVMIRSTSPTIWSGSISEVPSHRW